MIVSIKDQGESDTNIEKTDTMEDEQESWVQAIEQAVAQTPELGESSLVMLEVLCESIDDGYKMMTVLDGLKNNVISTIESCAF